MSRLEQRANNQVKIANARVNLNTLIVDLDDGHTISVPIGWYPRLADKTAQERANWEIVGAVCGIHWEDLDEDLGVEGLLLGKRIK